MNLSELQNEVNDVAKRTVTLMLKACDGDDVDAMTRNLDVLLSALDAAIGMEKERQLRKAVEPKYECVACKDTGVNKLFKDHNCQYCAWKRRG